MRTRPLALDDPAAVAELGKILRAASFNPVHVAAALGVQATLSTRTEELAELLARLPAGTALSSLIRLLVLGFPVDAHNVSRVLSPLSLERLDALANASRWITAPEGSSLTARQEILGRWRDYYDSRGIEFIGYGAIVLRG